MANTGRPTTASDDERRALAVSYLALAVREGAHAIAAIAMGDDYGAEAHRQFADSATRLALEYG